jgi:hypothetical protein
MFRNRITMMSEPEPLPVPRPSAPINPCGFMWIAVPVSASPQWAAQQWLYQRAFELAQMTARPSLIERDLCGVWN